MRSAGTKLIADLGDKELTVQIPSCFQSAHREKWEKGLSAPMTPSYAASGSREKQHSSAR
jgi:hypothetical protein